MVPSKLDRYAIDKERQLTFYNKHKQDDIIQMLNIFVDNIFI
jgi:hypothetical protein